MKLQELLEEAKQDKPGTYAAVTFDQSTVSVIEQYLKDNGIPNAIASSKLHTTLLYSRKHLPDYTAHGKINPPWIGKPDAFDVWKSQPKEDGSTKSCLVLKYTCDKLSERHKFLMDEYDATYDFPDYTPHITFSYDIGDMDASKFPDIKKALPEIKIIDEYSNDLEDDFASKSTKDD